ncbi:MAG: hypothetical protein IPN20_23245 [Haliscomenobacter sp.]|nr:hypothetical protein [Haliscomenobacter sp.]
MKQQSLIIAWFLVQSVFSIGQTFDVRSTNWGMTIQEVTKAEYPMEPEIEGNELVFSNVDIGNGFTATITYSFTNGKLTKVEYEVYGYKYGNARGTCKNIVSLYDKVAYSKFIFDALKEKGYVCDLGWYFLTIGDRYLADYTKKREDYSNCSNDKSTVDFVDKIAKENRFDRISIELKNKRCTANFRFNEHQNYPESNFGIQKNCDDEYYNIYFWLYFEPTSEVLKELNKNRF